MARKPESLLRSTLVAKLREAGLDAYATEGGDVCPGYPDVDYIGGKIEIKRIRRPSKLVMDGKSHVLVPHFVPAQRAWITQRCHRGGRVHVYLQIDVYPTTSWTYVLPGLWAAQHLGVDATLSALNLASTLHHVGTPPADVLAKALRR